MNSRILQLISTSGFFGAENVLLELSIELRGFGFDVTVGVIHNLYNPNTELADRAHERSLSTKIFACSGRMDISTLSQISKYVMENKIDIIHSHGYKSNIYSYLVNRKLRKTIVATCHNWINSNSKMTFYGLIDRWVLKKYDAVFSVSRPVEVRLLKAGLKKEHVHLIENGINVARFGNHFDRKSLKKDLFPSDVQFVVGTIGRLDKNKGYTYLLQAVSKLFRRNIGGYLLIVGDGELRGQLEFEAKELGIVDRVIFTGKRDDIPEMLSLMDVFVLSSLNEGQPMALLEAIAASVPVVATRVGDIPKILADGKFGYLVDAMDIDAIMEGIEHILKNPEQQRTISESAREMVSEKHSSERMAREYINIYKSIVQNI